ncbi:DtxR family transcriptional regulator [Thermanaerovibrio acidaminovorans]|uniref:metal-dependent transcriptional regulator n=1 Tax=Thermanaerovibrio acidaminovorans TaxID=81462 RepID=UPI00248F5972|nr:metal-dependent transcriptional regulator [Thermanaerovibrio acidaminovorans]
MSSRRSEDYLEEMLLQEIQGGTPSVTGLARALEVTKGTVVSVLKKLSSEGLLSHERYGTPALTEAGRARALSIYRRHYNLVFFLELLGVDQDRAGRIACEMEHLLDDDLEGGIFALSEFISQGIKASEGWARELQERLSNPGTLPPPLCLAGSRTCRVVRITAEGPLRKRLMEMGFIPGASVELAGESWDRDPLKVRLQGRVVALRRDEASRVWVTEA